MRELVRAPVQLQVCQDLRAKRYRYGLRRPGCLLFKELMEGAIFSILVHLKVGTLRPGYVSPSKAFFEIVLVSKWILSRNAKGSKPHPLDRRRSVSGPLCDMNRMVQRKGGDECIRKHEGNS